MKLFCVIITPQGMGIYAIAVWLSTHKAHGQQWLNLWIATRITKYSGVKKTYSRCLLMNQSNVIDINL